MARCEPQRQRSDFTPGYRPSCSKNASGRPAAKIGCSPVLRRRQRRNTAIGVDQRKFKNSLG